MKKRFLAMIALLLIIPSMIFATDVVISWEWMLDDPQIAGFRYQLNEENPENWIIVSGDTTTVVFEHLDGATEYSLYLQQTFDGVTWSESAISVAYPLYIAEETEAMDIVAEESVEEAPVEMMEEAKVEEKPIVKAEAEVEAPVEEMPVETKEMPVVAKEKVKKDSRYYTSIALQGGGIYGLESVENFSTSSLYSRYQVQGGLGLGFNNIVTLGKHVGLGFNLNADMVGYVNGSFYNSFYTFFTDGATEFSLRASLVPEMEFDFGKFVIDLGLIADVTLVDLPVVGEVELEADAFDYFVFGYGGKLGLAYQTTNWLQIGVEGSFRKVGGMNFDEGSWGIDAKAFLKATF